MGLNHLPLRFSHVDWNRLGWFNFICGSIQPVWSWKWGFANFPWSFLKEFIKCFQLFRQIWISATRCRPQASLNLSPRVSYAISSFPWQFNLMNKDAHTHRAYFDWFHESPALWVALEPECLKNCQTEPEVPFGKSECGCYLVDITPRPVTLSNVCPLPATR